MLVDPGVLSSDEMLCLSVTCHLNNMFNNILSIYWNIKQTKKLDTIPETNIAPENRPLQKEIPIGNHHLHGYVRFREGKKNICLAIALKKVNDPKLYQLGIGKRPKKARNRGGKWNRSKLADFEPWGISSLAEKKWVKQKWQASNQALYVKKDLLQPNFENDNVNNIY